MPRSHVIYAVFKRNFWSYFSGVTGYLFIIAFVTLGAYVAFSERFFTNNIASLDLLNEMFPWLLLFIVPAITMNIWSEERKLGTDELLFTLPVSDLEVLLGKFKAVVAVYTVALAFSLSHAIFLASIGQPDWGQLIAVYFGYWLAGAALLSAGMLASALTNSAPVAYVFGVLFAAVPVVLGTQSFKASSTIADLWLVGGLVDFLGRALQWASVGWNLTPFGRGQIQLGNVLYFASIAAFFLFLNYIVISRRRWNSGAPVHAAMPWHMLARGLCALVMVIAASIFFAQRMESVRADLTSEKLYTLTSTTYDVLKQVSDKRPVTIQAFVSRDVPREYVGKRTELLGTLDQFRSLGRGRVTVRVIDVTPFSADADEARALGVEPRKVQTERGGRVLVEDVFLGAVVQAGASEVLIPFFDVGIPIEYELTRSVRTVSQEERKSVGILDGDAKVGGGFDMTSFRSSPEWRIVTELKKQYKVEIVPADAPIDEKKYDVLVAILPSSLNQQQMENLVNYVKSGRPTLILDDPIPAFNPGLSPHQPKPRQGGNPMMGGMPGEPKADGGTAKSLVDLLGIQWKFDEVVWDTTMKKLHPEYADVVREEMVSISPQSGVASAFNKDNEITSGLQEVLLFFSGTIQPRQGSKLKFEPLLRTGTSSGLLQWDDLVEPGFMGGIEIREDPRRKVDDDAHVVAAAITSPKDAQGDKINVVYVADCDLVSDWFFGVRERRLYNLDLDNVTFVLNAVDHLSGDTSYIPLRKRRAKHRPLVLVEEQKSRFIDEASKDRETAAADAAKALDDAKARFKEKVDAIRKDNSMDQIAKAQALLIAQEEEQRRVSVEEANIERTKQTQIEKSRVRMERQVNSIEASFRRLALLFAPIPALLLGLAVWIKRLQDESRQVPESRRLAGRK